MQALKFTLSGKTAFFKRPEVNSYYYFTFGNVHKVALLGMFGAILGYEGYNKSKNEILPEFYQKLSNVKIAILPRNAKGYISKKIQYFNNSVGYASKEQGGNLIVKEQWLENPIWDILILLDNDEAERIKEAIINHRCEYIPYLGKNDHPATISNPQIVDLVEKALEDEIMTSLFIDKMFKTSDEDIDIDYYWYKENLPVALDAETSLYEYETFVFTDYPMVGIDGKVYGFDGNNIMFY